MAQPGLELGGRLSDHLEIHMGVLHPAVLPALAPVDPRLRRFDPGDVGLPRDHVGLADEFRHPEAVDDVRAAELDPDRLPKRNVKLVGGDGAIVAARSQVLELPPPAVGDHLDGQPRVLRRGAGLGDGDEHQHERRDQDQCRRDEAAPPDPGHGAPLFRRLPPAVPRGGPSASRTTTRTVTISTTADATITRYQPSDAMCVGHRPVGPEHRRAVGAAGQRCQRGDPGERPETDARDAERDHCAASFEGSGFTSCGCGLTRSGSDGVFRVLMYVTSFQIWSSGILGPHAGMPAGRPSMMVA